jgi:membrane associated rhomboid family serine protease
MTIQVETCYRHPDELTRVHCTRCGRPICPECMTPAPVGHHCPTCVAEGRRSALRVRRPLPRPRSATTAILAVNVVVFALDAVLRASGAGSLLAGGAMVPALVAQGEWWRLLTAVFLHAGLLHLALNSLGLYVFGSLIEQTLGTARFLAVYLVTGFAASAVSFTFGSPAGAAVGASGAIFGLLGAWLAYNLRRRSLSMARANVQWAAIVIAINLVFGAAIPGIDNLAHIGGLLSGVIAGFLVEGMGTRNTRAITAAAGLTLLVAAAAAITAWRAATLFG